MQTEKRFGTFLGLCLVFGLLTTAGCRNVQKVAAESRTDFANEVDVWKNFQDQKNVRGEVGINAFEAWVNALVQIRARLNTLTRYLESAKPQQLLDQKDNLSELRQSILAILSRVGRIDLQNVPSWKVSEAYDLIRAARGAFQDIRHRYCDLAKSSGNSMDRCVAPGFEDLVIVVQVDQDLIDTLDECIFKLRAFGIAEQESYCVSYGAEYCTHQMNLNCIDETLRSHRGQSCAEVSDVLGPISANEAQAVIPATWLSEISKCTSGELVFRR